MKSKTFGLDIGTTSIKAVWLGRKGETTTLESMVSVPSSPKSLLSESMFDKKMLADTIRNMINKAGVDVDNVNISLPESQVYSKILEMPELSEQELQAALRWQMEQHIPLPLDQVETDWEILDHRIDNGKRTMHVLIIAAPTGVIQKYDKILSIANLTSHSIETEIISVHRALKPLLNAQGSDMIVHLGASTTDVSITRDKIANMIFSIPLGGIAITRAISMDLGVDITQAENFKRAYGLSQQVFEGKIGKSLSPILESIIGDIKKAILSFREKYNDDIKQVILSGGTALLPGLDVFFTNMLNIQVGIGNSWEVNNIQNIPQEVIKDGPSYNVVLGLALRDLV